MVQKFKKIIMKTYGVEMTAKRVTSDITYAIITPVRKVFPTSKLILDEFHLYHTVASNVTSFTQRRTCRHSVATMKRDIHFLMTCFFPLDFDHSRDVV